MKHDIESAEGRKNIANRIAWGVVGLTALGSCALGVKFADISTDNINAAADREIEAVEVEYDRKIEGIDEAEYSYERQKTATPEACLALLSPYLSGGVLA